MTHEAKVAYLLKNGWTEVPQPPTRLVFWRDPLRPEREMWLPEAVRVQRRRERLVRDMMES